MLGTVQVIACISNNVNIVAARARLLNGVASECKRKGGKPLPRNLPAASPEEII